MKLSIVIPVKNEEFLTKKIIDQLQNKLKNLSYEIIFIDDFSTDNTVKVTKELIKDKPQINICNNERRDKVITNADKVAKILTFPTKVA